MTDCQTLIDRYVATWNETDLARFTWHLGPPDGEPIGIGFDVAVPAGDRIESVHGFLDKVPAVA